ncbi:hypothetical protein [Metabacillus iocasae]|uniref:Gfo/Idh/MocA-like oxidoreductase N-terminal domain-containing protein n=1 Tax=Priestia iocasae TaxID=2291674 RepID=A0ABS2QUQ1_9BACI|nr:hypothetical protein [Metabacillus iocasae]MBM7703013.1 hypothetical protein [Metabacillus iocasae]
MFSVVIIGGGNIGFRHFEGLLKVNLPLSIYVIDPSREALNRIQECYQTADIKDKKLHLLLGLDALPKEVDLSIVATSSKIRLKVIKELVSVVNVRYLLLEKVLFQKESDYDEMASLLKVHQVKGCWVNCPLRTMPIFKQVKEKIKKSVISYSVDYEHFGIGCNSIHQMDVFHFLTDGQVPHLQTNQLQEVVKSKREGYLELVGTLTGATNRGDELIISSHQKSSNTYMIKLQFDCEMWTIYPTLEQVEVLNTLTGKKHINSIQFPKQSTLTTKVVHDLLISGKSELSTYELSKQLHLPFIRRLNEFFSSQLNQEITECPIT